MSATFKANRNAVQDIAAMSVACGNVAGKTQKAIAKGVEERTPVGVGDPRHATDAIYTYTFNSPLQGRDPRSGRTHDRVRLGQSGARRTVSTHH